MGNEPIRKNNLFTQSYLSQRLRSSGFKVKKLPIRYEASDSRYWSMLVDKEGKNYNAQLTCLRSSLKEKRGIFIIFSSRSKNLQLDTLSAEVVCSSLNQLFEAIDEDRAKEKKQ